MMNLFHRLLNLRNQVDYPLRQFFQFRRRIVPLKHKRVLCDYSHLSDLERNKALQIEDRLATKYHLEDFKRDSKPGNYYENIFYLHMLEETFTRLDMILPQKILSADIGTSHWFYIQALQAFYTWFMTEQPRQVHLEGYEVDAYRIYADFHSRFDHALSHIGSLPNIQFIPSRFKEHGGVYDVITLFFPFVFNKDSIEWGLPQRLHQPEELLRSAWNSLKPGGVLMIVNQGEDEHHAQLSMLEKESIPVKIFFRMDPLLFQYDLCRFIMAATK